MEAPEGNVVMENGQLICTGDYSCQWYWNGEPISGAMQNSVTTDDNGVYQVLWTSPEGCTAYSEQYVINSVMEQAAELSVFPNPAINEARVMLPPGVYDLFVYDSSGRALIRQQNFNTLKSIDLTGLTTGVYTIVAVQPGVVYRGLLSVR